MFPTLLVILTRLPMTPASASDANQPSNTPMPVSLKPLRSTDHHLATRGAQRDANSDLLRSLRDVVPNEAADPNRREQHGGARKEL